MAKQNSSPTYEITEPGEWSVPKLIVLGALFLASFFVFIYNVSP